MRLIFRNATTYNSNREHPVHMAARYSYHYHYHIVNMIIITTYIIKRECSSKFEERFRALMKQVRSTQVVIDEGITIIIIIIIGYYYYYYYQLHSKQKLKVQNLVLGEADHRVDQVLVKDVQHHIFLLQVSSLPLLLPLLLPS